MDVDLFTQTPAAAAGDLARLGAPANGDNHPEIPETNSPTGRYPAPTLPKGGTPAASLSARGVGENGKTAAWGQPGGLGITETAEGGIRGSGPLGSGQSLGKGQALLATWRRLLDNGRSQDDEPHLAATARDVAAKLNPATASAFGVTFGELITVSTDRGSITLPAESADLPDDVVWLPENSPRCAVRRDLGVGHGAVVTIAPAGGDR
jgi:NADH-quinone oxidoreductase subunit G